MWKGACRLAALGMVTLAAAWVATADGGPMAHVRQRVWPGSSAADRETRVTAPAAPAPARVRAEGRVASYPGARVVVGAEIGGRLARILVAEKSRVRQGDLLAELDADEARAAVAEAKARVDEADADVRWAESEARRQEELRRTVAGTEQALERARIQHDAAAARLRAARAGLARLEASLAKTRIVAPIDGVVLERRAEAGEIVAPGAPLVTLADLARVRIEAEVDEYDAGRIAVGAGVTVTAEGYDGREWSGRVEEVPDAVGPRRLEPHDPGRPTDVRILRVKVALSDPAPLKLGQRVEVRLDVAPLRD